MLLQFKHFFGFFYRIPRASFIELWSFLRPTVEIEGIKIKIENHFSRKMRRTIRGGSYEKEEIQVVKSKLLSHDVVMEIGTGIGFLSSYCSKKIGSSRVFTYEGNPEMVSCIMNTYKFNEVSPTFDNCIISENNGEEKFYIDNDFYSSSTIAKNSKSKCVTVPTKSFNQELQKINPTFLIIDIEGGEYELSKYANFDNVQKILMEVHPNILGQEKLDSVKLKLVESGFKFNQNLSSNTIWFLEKND